MTGPDDQPAAGGGHLRAAHADREQVVAVLKAAFVQGRLTKDELDTRVAQALASKTYADLSALTADIPPFPLIPSAPIRSAAPGLASTPARTLRRGAHRSVMCLITGIALTEGAFLANNAFFLILACLAFIAASGFIGYGIIDARQERRSRAQLPAPGSSWPAPGQRPPQPRRP
jgi:Domain of unknown function (DUF1707)